MRILIFGDSIAQGFYDSQGGWVQHIINDCHKVSLKQMLAGKEGDLEVFNMGVSGDTTQAVLDRIQTETEARRWKDDPILIVLAVGINDATLHDNVVEVEEYDFQQVYEALLNKTKELTSSVLCVGLSAVDESMTNPWPYSSAELQWKNNRINLFEDTIKQSAINLEVPFVAVHDRFLSDLQSGHQLLSDGLHPNDAGHKLMYQIIKPELAKLIGNA